MGVWIRGQVLRCLNAEVVKRMDTWKSSWEDRWTTIDRSTGECLWPPGYLLPAAFSSGKLKITGPGKTFPCVVC